MLLSAISGAQRRPARGDRVTLPTRCDRCAGYSHNQRKGREPTIAQFGECPLLRDEPPFRLAIRPQKIPKNAPLKWLRQLKFRPDEPTFSCKRASAQFFPVRIEAVAALLGIANGVGLLRGKHRRMVCVATAESTPVLIGAFDPCFEPTSCLMSRRGRSCQCRAVEKGVYGVSRFTGP